MNPEQFQAKLNALVNEAMNSRESAPADIVFLLEGEKINLYMWMRQQQAKAQQQASIIIPRNGGLK